MTEFIVAGLCIFVGVAWAEFREWLPWLAKKVLAQAVLGLPTAWRARMHEELSAELTAVPGKLSPLLFACSLWWCFWRNAILTRIDAALSKRVLRSVDIVLSAVFIFLCAPIFAFSLVATCLSCGRFGIWKTTRNGKDDVPFTLFRFQIRHHLTGKVTRVGRTLYRLSLDELPILVNVLQGDMSLVGPPPTVGRQAAGVRRSLKPGVAWLQSTQGEDLGSFGVSTLPSLRVYFKSLANVIHTALVH